MTCFLFEPTANPFCKAKEAVADLVVKRLQKAKSSQADSSDLRHEDAPYAYLIKLSRNIFEQMYETSYNDTYPNVGNGRGVLVIRWLLRLLCTLLLAIMGGVVYFGYHIWSAAERVYEPTSLSKSALRSHAVDIAKDPVALLLVGVDERRGDQGRADSIIVATINPHQKNIMLTHIPRDTLVDIPGRIKRDKINHSYAYGGIDLTRKTVEQFLHIPIDGYVKVNMQGLKDIVNKLGGVEVKVPMSFRFGGHQFKQGIMRLNGDQSLAFARMRKSDPRGDFGRMKRQQELIRGIIHQSTSLHSLTQLADVLEHLSTNVKTDITPVHILKLQRLYANLPSEQFRSCEINGKNTKINGVYYFQVSKQEQQRIHRQLAEHIDWQPVGQ